MASPNSPQARPAAASADPANPAACSKTTRVADPELQALEKIGKLLAEFPEHVRMRMIGYLNAKFMPDVKTTWVPPAKES